MEGERPLERRHSAGKRGGKAPAASRKKPAALTVSQFRQQLSKYSQRKARFGSDFALAALDILEHAEVRRSLGQPAAEQLSALGRDLCLNGIRGADRLCIPEPGSYLIIMPETAGEQAGKALERLAKSIASAKIHYKHKPLHASCSFRVADSASFPSDPEAMLASIGYKVDEQGSLARVDQPGPASQLRAGAGVASGGTFSTWAGRYGRMEVAGEAAAGERLYVVTFTAVDLWAGERAVKIKAIEPAASGITFGAEMVDLILRRARVLQSIDHPGLAAVSDYHLREARTLYLVRNVTGAECLSGYLSENPLLKVSRVVDWGMQLCNSLIYLQGLMPPVVPPPLSPEMVTVEPGSRLVLTDFELPFLFPSWCYAVEMTGEDLQAVAQGRPIAAYDPVIRSLGTVLGDLLRQADRQVEPLARLFSTLAKGPLPAELNTVYKIRSALKEISASEKLGPVDATACPLSVSEK